jgi:hypothetical protein
LRIVTVCFIALLGISACHKESLPNPGGAQDLAAAGDLGGAAHDLATARDGAVGPPADLALSTADHVCAASDGKCANAGVTCGTVCCPGGEWCDPATLTCQCGSNPGCQDNSICVALTGPPNASPCGETCQPIL